MGEIKYTICFVTHDTQNSCLWTREKTTPPPLPLAPPPLSPPLCLSLIFYIPGKCCELWNVTLFTTGIISERKPMDKRDGNEVDRHWCGAFRWRNTGEDYASILIVLYYFNLGFQQQETNVASWEARVASQGTEVLSYRRDSVSVCIVGLMYNLQCTNIQLDKCQSAEREAVG